MSSNGHADPDRVWDDRTRVFLQPIAPPSILGLFGFAGAMSPALWFAGGGIFPFVREAEYAPGRIYLDVGSQEGMQAVFDARRMRRVLMQKGYDTGRKFRYLEEAGAEHTESAWASRLSAALHFLVPWPGAAGTTSLHAST